VELLIVVTILPLVIGGLSFGLLSVLKLQSSVSNRLSDTEDAQVVSSVFNTDVQAATYITTQPSLSVDQCGSSGSGVQLLGLKWDQSSTTNNWEYVVSYVDEPYAGGAAGTYQLVRQYCASPSGAAITPATTPTSTIVLANDVTATQLPPTVACSVTCAPSSNWIQASLVTSVTFSITEPLSSYSYTLVGVPQASSSSTSTGSAIAANNTTSCGFAAAGSGAYAANLCLTDFSSLTAADLSAAQAPGCLEVSVSLPNSYTMYYCLSISGDPVQPASLPVFSNAFLGNNCANSGSCSGSGAPFYYAIPGDPALYQTIQNATTTITFKNITVVNDENVPATGWEVVSGDAENTTGPGPAGISEYLTWSANTPVYVLPNQEPWDTTGTVTAGSLTGTYSGSANLPLVGEPIYGGTATLSDETGTVTAGSLTGTYSGAANQPVVGAPVSASTATLNGSPVIASVNSSAGTFTILGGTVTGSGSVVTDPVGNSCGAGLGLWGSSTDEVQCWGQSTNPAGVSFSTTYGAKNGAAMVWSPSPSTMTISMYGSGLQAIVFGLLLA
jgi:hypothetical protein